MAVDLSAEDYADLNPYNLDPRTGLDTSSVRQIRQVAQSVFPETSSGLIAPVSLTAAPRGAQLSSLMPAPGQPVNLLPENPITLSAMPPVEPVIPAGSVAPQVQRSLMMNADENAQPGAQPNIQMTGLPVQPPVQLAQATLPQAQPVPIVPPGPSQGRATGTPGQGQGVLGSQLPSPVSADPEHDQNLQKLENQKKELAKQKAIADNPMMNFGLRSQTDAAREEVKRIQGEMVETQKAIQQGQTNLEYGKNLNLIGPMSSLQDVAASNEQAIKELKEGNYGAYLGLKSAGQEVRGVAALPQAMPNIEKYATKASDMFADLDKSFKNANDYARVRGEILAEAKKNPIYRQYNLTEDKIPVNNLKYEKDRGLLQGPSKTVNQEVASYRMKQADIGNPVPLTGDAALGVGDESKFQSGQPKPNGMPRGLPNVGGVKTMYYPDSTPNPEDYHKGGKWTGWNPATQEVARKMISENPEVKGVLDQNNMAVKFNDITKDDANYKDSTGRTLIADGAAGVFRNMSEMARAAGNIGLIRVWEHEMGVVGTILNKASTNWGQYVNWLNSGQQGDMPPIPREDEWSQEVKNAFKRIGKFNLDESNKQLPRASGVAAYTGQMAGDLTNVGVSPDAAKILEPIRAAAEHQARVDWDRPDRLIIKGHVFELNNYHNVPENTPGFVKGGSFKESWDNMNRRVQQPAAPANPALSGTLPARTQINVPAPTGPAPTNAPATVDERFNAIGNVTSQPVIPVAPPAAPGRRSMLDVINPISPAHAEEGPQEALRSEGLNLLRGAAPPPTASSVAPSGGSPTAPGPQAPPGGGSGFNPATYNTGLTAESGGQNLPPNSSGASGYHQFIKETWNANKPPGAPDEAYKATKEQQDYARDNYTAKNAQSLDKNGLPVNNFTLSVAHNLGAGSGGASSLLTAPDNDIALKHVNRVSANNNKPFFWEGGNGRLLTVAESKAKYAEFYNTGGVASPKPIGDMTLSELHKEARERKAAGLPQRGEADRSALARGLQHAAADVIPAAAETAGFYGGGLAGGPPGALAGSTIMGAISHPLRDYLSGDLDKQDAASLALSTAGGAGEGFSQGLPVTGLPGAALRIGGTSTAAGLTDYLQTGDPRHALNKAAFTGAGTAVGELAGLGINKALAPYLERLPIADHDIVKNAAEVIATQKPQIMDAAGRSAINPVYAKAEQDLISRGMDPHRIAADVKATETGPTEFGRATISRPAEAERLAAASDLDKVPRDVGTAHAAIPAANRAKLNADLAKAVEYPDAIVGKPGVADHPMLQTAAKTAKTEMSAPATNYGQVVENFATARTTLLTKERYALQMSDANPLYPEKDDLVKGFRNIGDHIREQQNKVIDHLLPPQQAAALKEHLTQASDRYRKAILAGGDDIVATIAKGGKNSNEARNAFMAVAKNDPSAERWMNAMVEAEKNKGSKNRDLLYVMGGLTTAAGAIPLIGVPTAATIGAVTGVLNIGRAKRLAADYITMKGAGKLVNFDQLVRNDITPFKQEIQRGASTLGATVGGDVADQVTRKPTVENRGARVPVSQ